MYRQYFGLNSLPFKTTPDLEMFYKQGSRQEILEALLYTVTRGDGIVKVTGEVGSGKTMLLRLLADQLPDDFEVIYINSPNLSAKDIVLYISEELGIDLDGKSQKFTIVNELKKELLRIHSIGKKVVMLVDEAQSMTFDALEELRLLSNIETDRDKLLQMVLFGQPELDRALEHEQIRQLKSRISYSIYVPPLIVSDVQAYLNYRMRKAGYDGLDVFNLKVSKQIQKLTNGLPRNINIVADKVLMAVFSSGDKFAKNMHLQALPDLEGIPNNYSLKTSLSYILAITLVLVTSILLYFLYQQNSLNINSDQSMKPVLNLESKKSTLEHSSSSNQTGMAEINVDHSLKSETGGFDKKTVFSEGSVSKPELLENNKQSGSLNFDKVPVINHDRDTADLFDYKIKNPDAIVGNPAQLNKILRYHKEARNWVLNVGSNYAIQLSTRHIRSLDSTLKFYSGLGMDLDSIHILVDYNKNVDKFRLKVFYLSSSKFSELSTKIDELPQKMRTSNPYIARIDQLEQNLRYTEKKLEQIGIVHEY
ncbi:ExeA family protein [Thiomicrorhabdus sp. Kp2]|uniref:ExeA family protein n=1 Tax=Thiomicrorhabdus sp. Kp2 TaxID=1123518 RepID=UPI0003F55AA7|nr:AAA family ATPase [Thiomicrorhabdus sp. Kp2]